MGTLLGARLPRIEDPPLLTGRARFVGDVRRPGQVEAYVLRSPHAHARLKRIDAERARRLPGVLAIFTWADLAPLDRPIPMRLSPLTSLERFLQFPLARDKVRYVGEPVALVVAETRYLAEDAAELVEVEYEPLEAVTDARAALDPQAPLLHEAAGTNLAAEFTQQVGDAGAALATADLVVTLELSIGRHAAVPLETRGLVAEYDSGSGRLTVWGPTKVPHFNRAVLARLLELPEEQIHFIETAVGGGFGARGEFYPEDFLIPWAARRLGRPVAWQEDRCENLLACNHSRQQHHQAQLGVRSDGAIVALVDQLVNDQGAYVRTHGATVPALTSAMLPGPYRVTNYRCHVLCALTNKTPTGTYRGPGRFEAAFVRERLLDEAARRLGMDPAEIRRRNFIPPEAFPYPVGTHTLGQEVVYDSGRYRDLFEQALVRFDYSGWRERQRAARQAGRYLGIGLACFVEKSGLGPWEWAQVRLAPHGEVEVRSGLAQVGQGAATAMAQITADRLGIALDAVRVVTGDTDLVPRGHGAFASRGTVMGGSAVFLAAERLRERLLQLAAEALEVAPADVELHAGAASVRGLPERRVTLGELAARAGGAGGLIAEATFDAPHMVYPYGVHLAAVEVDPATGAVELQRYLVAYDVGRAVNPTMIEGQLIGGVAQGIGGALFEEFAYGPDGQLLAGSFMDYLLPTAREVPRVDILLREDAPSPLNPLGLKGAGEGGVVGGGAVLASAIEDALAPFGVRFTELPITPERIRAALRQLEPAGGASRPQPAGNGPW